MSRKGVVEVTDEVCFMLACVLALRVTGGSLAGMQSCFHMPVFLLPVTSYLSMRQLNYPEVITSLQLLS